MDRKVDYLKKASTDESGKTNSLNIPVYRKPEESASSDSGLKDLSLLAADLGLNDEKIRLSSNSLTIPAKADAKPGEEKKAAVSPAAAPSAPAAKPAEDSPANSLAIPKHAIPTPAAKPAESSLAVPRNAAPQPKKPAAAPEQRHAPTETGPILIQHDMPAEAKKPAPQAAVKKTPEAASAAAAAKPISAAAVKPAEQKDSKAEAPVKKSGFEFPFSHKDRKPQKMSYAERMAVGKKFYQNLLKVFLVTCLICGVGLGYLWFWLTRYESRSINGAIRTYLKLVENKDWESIYQEDTDNFTELNSKDKYINFLKNLYGTLSMSSVTYSFTGADDVSQYYGLYVNGYQLITLELRKPESSETWKVRTLSTTNSYSFDQLDTNAAFLLNNIPIEAASAASTGDVVYAFANLGLDEKMPTVTRFTMPNFVDDPDITVADPSKYIAIRDWTANQYYIGPIATNDQTTEFSQEIQDTAETYCRYITKDGTFAALNKHLYPGTDFYNNITGFNNQWFSSHDSIEFQNVKVYDVLPVGENAFIGSISFDYLVSASDVQKTYSSDYQLFFVKNSTGLWKMTNLAIISDNNGDTITAAAAATASPQS